MEIEKYRLAKTEKCVNEYCDNTGNGEVHNEEVHPCLPTTVGELYGGQHTAVAHNDEDEEKGHEHQLWYL